jgi:hypothetical protein
MNGGSERVTQDKMNNAGQAPKPTPGDISANDQAGASPVAPKDRAQLYTRNAGEALNAAELINTALKKRVIGSVVARRVEVAPPSGPSTSGGRKARQSITLVQASLGSPPSPQHAAAIMIGFLDVAQKVANVREYELVAKQYEARFRSPFETTKEEYQELTKDLLGMLATLGYKLVADEPREDERISAPSPEPALSGNKPFMIAAAVVAFALLGLWLTRC